MHRAWPAEPRVLLQLTTGDWAVIVVLLLIGLAIKAFVLWWLYLDTTRRGQPPLWWLVAAVPFDLPTLVVWLIVRPPLSEAGAHPELRHQIHQAQPGDAEPMDPTTGPSSADETPETGEGPETATPARQATGNGTVRVTCPHCATRFHVTARDSPQRVECPSCQATGTIGATR